MKPDINQQTLCRAIATCLLLSITQVATAAPVKPQPVATVAHFNTSLTLQLNNDIEEKDTHTTITGPRGFSANATGKSDINLANFGELDDGLYKYEITAPTGKTIKLRQDRLNNGRGDKERDTIIESETQTGNFRVKDGNIVNNDQTLKEG